MVRTVLFIDYDPRSIGFIRPVLQSMGLRIQLARDGPTALEMFHDLRPDLVLVQDLVPRKHGFDICRQIKSTDLGQATPVILLATLTNGRRHEIPDTGCDACIEKPIRPQLLIGQIRKLLPDLDSAPVRSDRTDRPSPRDWCQVSFDADEEEIERTVDDAISWTQSAGPIATPSGNGLEAAATGIDEDDDPPADKPVPSGKRRSVRKAAKSPKRASSRSAESRPSRTTKKKTKTTRKKKAASTRRKKKTGGTTKTSGSKRRSKKPPTQRKRRRKIQETAPPQDGA